MKVLVTGGHGFIGSHLVDRLIDLGHHVVVVDDQSANNEKFYVNEKAENHVFSICDSSKLQSVTKDCQFAFHLAAESRLQNAINDPRRAVDVNIGGTLSVLDACVANKINGLVFSSTSSIYGLTDKLPIKEDLPEDCLNPYASTKYAAELLIRNYTQLHGLRTNILRYFNVFGERAPAKGQYALVTSIFLRQKKAGEPLTIVGDGSQKRDFIYVKDVVEANIRCMEQWDSSTILGYADVFNVGSSKEVSVLELANKISNNIVFIPERLGEAKNNLCSYQKFFNATVWTPSVDVLEWLETQ
jgi:UDP-glucose 4-epimerase